MLRQALAFKFDPQLMSGTDQAISLPVQIVVKGPWSGPRIYPDVSNNDLKKIEKKGKKLLKKLFGN